MDYKRWCDLRSSFESSTHGSKIIMTTHSSKVALDLGTIPEHNLHILSEDDCWKLFRRHAFNNVEQGVSSDLEVIGLENVVNVENDSEANLTDKKHITELELGWNVDIDDSVNAHNVLDRLPPHTEHKELYICNIFI
ncbi:putative disease resistance RPP13-like protein 3 [Ziziphus jujuba]|uniref:Disease resistance RPP13-like protein 3 n=1 Tax=Ziziphus jujuba TaxID=326968 RepID=A0ABM4A2P0_ZIZJJ|nr:putative disease resistance RPP13-like protein 3 [Ziziphus jujuba]